LLSCVTVAVEIALVRFIYFDFPGENIIKRFLKDVCINVSIIVFLPSCKLWLQFIAFCSAIRLKLHVHLILVKRKPIR